jgi:hypothetical protein
MWINVKFLGPGGVLLAERGSYDAATATLSESDTKVYEAKLGLDADIAQLTGKPGGPAFRLALSNKIFKDNRIPPMGFANAAFEQVQAGHVPSGQYADGQHWDDVPFGVPPGARTALVTVYHQTTSRPYIEFLRDANTSNNAGQIAFQLWEQLGKSEPVEMDRASITLPCACDWNADSRASVTDIFEFLSTFFAALPNAGGSGGSGGGGVSSEADFNNDGVVNRADIFAFLDCFFAGC